MIDYWDAVTFEFPEEKVNFEFKTDTDLYEFMKESSYPLSLSFSKNGKMFSCVSSNRKVKNKLMLNNLKRFISL